MISQKLLSSFAFSPSFLSPLSLCRFFSMEKKGKELREIAGDEEHVMKHNYNFEQYPQYKKIIKEAKEIKEKRLNPESRLPRRKRRVYDRPKHDTSLENYTSWRSFDRLFFKPNFNSLAVVCKIIAPPKAVKHIFGIGHPPESNGKHSTREYHFEDSNLDMFLVYDYKSTTAFWGDNDPKRPNQDHLAPKRRKLDHLTPEEFWESEEPHSFRVNSTQYADKIKFKLWFLEQVHHFPFEMIIPFDFSSFPLELFSFRAFQLVLCSVELTQRL